MGASFSCQIEISACRARHLGARPRSPVPRVAITALGVPAGPLIQNRE